MSQRFALGTLLLALGCGGGSNEPAGDAGGGADAGGGPPLRDVVLVGDSVSGTVTVLDGLGFEPLGAVNVIPDLEERLAEIEADALWSVVYSVIRDEQKLKHFEPGDGDRFVDDVFVSPDGTRMYISRANLGDVAAFDLVTPGHPLVWRTRVTGYKADHAALSHDGTRLVVSATTEDVADVFDTATGAVLGSFPAGNFPHQNDFSADGTRIYNASIGDVTLPHAQDAQKGARQVTVVDAETLEVLRVYEFDKGVRPAVFNAGETIMYAQLSYLNGVISYDLEAGQILHTLEQPYSAFALANYPTPDDYPHDSAHHGLALSADGTLLCDAGTIDNTVSFVTTASMTVAGTVDTGLIPYWATTSADGTKCLVSLSGDDQVAVLSYETRTELMRVLVGRFPQRVRLGRVPDVVVAGLEQPDR